MAFYLSPAARSAAGGFCPSQDWTPDFRGGYLSADSTVYSGRLVGMSVGVVVTGVVMLVDLDRRGATVSDFTFNTLELDGGVVNAELLPQLAVHLLQDTSTF